MHEVREGVVGIGPEEHVPVVAHDAIAAKPHAGAGDAFGEDVFEGNEIEILFEDSQAAVGAVYDVICDSPFGYAFESWHKGIIQANCAKSTVKSQNYMYLVHLIME